MAKREEPRTKDPQKWSDIEYLKCELDGALTEDLKSWLKSEHDWLSYIDKEVANGYRFGCHEDKYNRCFEARLTLLSQSVGINTLVLQGRGPDTLSAVQSLFFKHYIVLEGDWENLDRDGNRRYSSWG